ncbi:MAG: fluoride efflux transporter CrcB [Vicinamibacterales bacterium]
MMVVWVMVAGGLGSGARFMVGQWAAQTLGLSFPYGTLLVNLIGCFLLGAVVQLSAAGTWSPDLRAAIAAGFLGGFTTYSSFNQETMSLLTGSAAGTALAYVAVTIAGGLAAGSLGLAVARLIQS